MRIRIRIRIRGSMWIGNGRWHNRTEQTRGASQTIHTLRRDNCGLWRLRWLRRHHLLHLLLLLLLQLQLLLHGRRRRRWVGVCHMLGQQAKLLRCMAANGRHLNGLQVDLRLGNGVQVELLGRRYGIQLLQSLHWRRSKLHVYLPHVGKGHGQLWRRWWRRRSHSSRMQLQGQVPVKEGSWQLHLWWSLGQERGIEGERRWWRRLHGLHGQSESQMSGRRTGHCNRCGHRCRRANNNGCLQLRAAVLGGVCFQGIVILRTAIRKCVRVRVKCEVGTHLGTGATNMGGGGFSCFSSIFLKFSKKEPSLQNVFLTFAGGCSRTRL